jgi:Ribosomal protein L21E
MITWLPGQRGLDRELAAYFRKSKRERRRLFIGRTMHTYQEGDKVAIVLDGAQQKGMPHRRFQGRTGEIPGTQGGRMWAGVPDGNMMKTGRP